ncbi:hypothetical protein [Caulobacter hibisci]|uniref:DUF3153 domain-containing protein n=1 Tax=Caulobacter hibisci TaxID=2035993 RepID=A0ABS0T1N4_9CAUL|nr:hypothetical protein [Caulobacter hibisci]MBI1685780.1 hypothetical protein [Caulobacter hibisci]
MRALRGLVFTAVLALGACQRTGEASVAPGETVPVAAENLIFCELVGQKLSREDCDNAGLVESKVKAGVGAFNVPLTMLRGRTVKIQLAIGEKTDPPPSQPSETTTNASAVDNSVAPPPEGAPETPQPAPSPPPPPPPPETPSDVVRENEGTVIDYHPVMGRRMAADLTGTGFKIEPLSERVQTVSSRGLTTWEWAVTPTSGGSQSLTMKTAVVFTTSDDKELALATTTRSKTVAIRVNALQYIWDVIVQAPTWLKAIGALLAALGGVFTAWRAMIGAARGQEDKSDGDRGDAPAPPAGS